ncbi:hypothetical protein T01_12520 [Trichinella spiralis]|uniref:Uncharacterized protein n=1 Tax=Trichinella spiralis TaxID=6334 RepID=A0A0V1AIW8_TRISP|nr:hypothetical protein T01_12520 [Trichinella spiralis]
MRRVAAFELYFQNSSGCMSIFLFCFIHSASDVTDVASADFNKAIFIFIIKRLIS